MDYRYGFTAKLTSHSPGMYLRFPNLTTESAQLQDQQLLQLKIRTQNNQVKEVSLKTQKSSGQVKVYLGKNTVEELELQHNELVDVLFRKK